jgi:hypothetical protein
MPNRVGLRELAYYWCLPEPFITQGRTVIIRFKAQPTGGPGQVKPYAIGLLMVRSSK